MILRIQRCKLHDVVTQKFQWTCHPKIRSTPNAHNMDRPSTPDLTGRHARLPCLQSYLLHTDEATTTVHYAYNVDVLFCNLSHSWLGAEHVTVQCPSIHFNCKWHHHCDPNRDHPHLHLLQHPSHTHRNQPHPHIQRCLTLC
jgi:hypothetical protein